MLPKNYIVEDGNYHTVYSMQDLLELSDSDDDWIVPGMIPLGGKTFVYGDGSSYKTHLMFDLCIAIASGGYLLNHLEVKKWGPVLVNSTEGNIRKTKRRIMNHVRSRGCNPLDVHFHVDPVPYIIEDNREFNELRRALDRIKPLVLLMDPLDSCLLGNENDATETREFRRRADLLTREHGVSLIIIHHAPKSGGTLRGSSAWFDWGDAVLHFMLKQKQDVGLTENSSTVLCDILTVISTKQRDGERGSLFTVIPLIDAPRGLYTHVLYDVGRDKSKAQELVKDAYARAKVYGMLRDGGAYTDSGLRDALGISQERLARVLGALEQSGCAVKDAEVRVPTSIDGLRSRPVAAWRAKVQVTLVDAAICLAQAGLREMEQQLEQSTVLPSADGRHLHAVRDPGVQSGS